MHHWDDANSSCSIFPKDRPSTTDACPWINRTKSIGFRKKSRVNLREGKGFSSAAENPRWPAELFVCFHFPLKFSNEKMSIAVKLLVYSLDVLWPNHLWSIEGLALKFMTFSSMSTYLPDKRDSSEWHRISIKDMDNSLYFHQHRRRCTLEDSKL